MTKPMKTYHANLSETARMRSDFALIAKWVKPGSKVLDLGCGDGALLGYLRDTLDVFGYGVEKDDHNWLAALKNDINVIQMDLEAGLSGFEAQSFEVVILSQTLQAVQNTEGIILEMLRVGREAIVTFPNFGYWRHRLQLINGQMPVSKICLTNGLTPPMCIFARSRISICFAPVTKSGSRKDWC